LSTKFRRSCRRLLQISRPLTIATTDSSRKTSVTSYLYSSVSKNRSRKSRSYSYQTRFGTIRSNSESENRDNDEIFIPTFQVVNEEDDENTVQQD